MISAMSTLIVEDLGKVSFAPIGSISTSMKIKPLSVLIKKRPRRWKFFTSQQYMAEKFLISDLLSETSDAFKDIPIESSSLPAYERERIIDAGVSGKVFLEFMKTFPSLKAEAAANGKISIKIKSGGFSLRTVDENAFIEAMREQKIDNKHPFIKSFLEKSGRRLCVIKTVVETIQDTVVEIVSQKGGKANISAEVGTQGGAFTVAINSSNNTEVKLEAGTVVACQWQLMDVDKKSLAISPCYKLSVEKRDLIVDQAVLQTTNEEEIEAEEELKDSVEEVEVTGGEVNEAKEEASEDLNESDDGKYDEDEDSESDSGTDDMEEMKMYRGIITIDSQDYEQLYHMLIAREDEKEKLKTAVCMVMNNSVDIETILALFDDWECDIETFNSKLQNSDAVWTFLKLVGHELQDNCIKLCPGGPFHKDLLESLLEAVQLFDSEDLEFIGKCDSYQKKEILRIIQAALQRPDSIPIDPTFKPELQKEPVAHILALLNFDIDFIKGELSQPSDKICVVEPMMFLLHCL